MAYGCFDETVCTAPLGPRGDRDQDRDLVFVGDQEREFGTFKTSMRLRPRVLVSFRDYHEMNIFEQDWDIDQTVDYEMLLNIS